MKTIYSRLVAFVFAAILLISTTACSANWDRAVKGTYTAGSEDSGVTFIFDGKGNVTLSAALLSLDLAEVEGTYTIDEENSKIELTFPVATGLLSSLSTTYSGTFDFVLEDDRIAIQGITYKRVPEE